jgi:UDP-hydrolysing UDP-N-acetyl-D-glucosamine 2-epimerase
MRKVCVVVTARPSYARIKTLLRAITASPNLDLQLVASASALEARYGQVTQTIAGDGFLIGAELQTLMASDSATGAVNTATLNAMQLDTVFRHLRPDVVVTVADRFETLMTAYTAAMHNLPVCHIQGGEVTGSIDEKIRHAVTKLSDLHFVATALSRARVVAMGERLEAVHLTGCPSIDLAAAVLAEPESAFDPFARYGGVGNGRDLSRGYVVVLQHPVTTEAEQAGAQARATLEAVMQAGVPALWFWPNVDMGTDAISKTLRVFHEQHPKAPLHLFRHFAPEDFLRLLKGALCLVGNSSAGIRECSYLGTPVVNIGSRQRGRERGPNVQDVEGTADEILWAVDKQMSHGRFPSTPLYGDGQAGARMARLLAEVPLTHDKRLTY